MIASIKSYLSDFAHLFFPHNCEGCGTDNLQNDEWLCTKCAYELPETNFINTINNPVEKIFYGRINIQHAAAAFYFTKDAILQKLLIQLKYKGNQQVGLYLGMKLGEQLKAAERFNDIDAIIPLPLNPKKEIKRGYNQAQIICEGIVAVWKKPIYKNIVARKYFTETQTQQNRVHRWQNMQSVFEVSDTKTLANKHILLIDDVITTGATLEACGAAILKIQSTKLSIATVAYTI
jgi:ComF family protein